MELFAVLLTIMTKYPIFDVDGGRLIHHWYLCFLFSLTYSSEKSQVTLKNLSKALKKHLERDLLLEEIKVLNQDLSICRKTGTVLVLTLDIDFSTLWDDPMQDSSLTIINIFQLFKQTVLINADKICSGIDDCKAWERRI